MPKRTRDHHTWLLDQLSDPVFASEYLNEARSDSRKAFLKALRNVAESRRMAVVAEQTGLNRESLYKSLSEDGNPRLETYDSVLTALGLDYVIKPRRPVTTVTDHPPSQSTIGSEPITAVGTMIGFVGQTKTKSQNSYLEIISLAACPQLPAGQAKGNSELAQVA